MSDLLDNFRQFPPKAKKITNSWNDRLRNTLGSLAEHSDGTRKEKTWPHQWRTDQSTAGARRYDRRGTDRHRVPRLQLPPLAGSLPLVRREDARRRFFFFQAEDGIRDVAVTGVQTCALPISTAPPTPLSAVTMPPEPACAP